MAYRKILEISAEKGGFFYERPNRFLGIVDIDGKKERVHVHDPGRLKELLYQGNRVLVKKANRKGRKTGWDLIAARHGEQWVLVNSAYHRPISEWLMRNLLFPDADSIRAEVKVGHSRLDFLVERRGEITGVEVKGCTLTENGIALFPDAPTERGKRHVETLMDMIDDGKKALLLILVFRKDSECFAPNERTDPGFSEVFGKAVEKGVEVRPIVLSYEKGSVRYVREIGVCRRV